MRSQLLTLAVLCALIAPAVPKLSIAPASAAPAHKDTRLADQSPLFIANVGQLDAGVRFQMRGRSASLFLTDEALWLTVLDPQSLATAPRPEASAPSAPIDAGTPQRGTTARALRGVNLKLSFVGANPHPQLEPFERSSTHVSLFQGRQSGWHADVPVWSGVRYRDLYPGIDLELSGAHGQLEQRLRAQPGADLSAVRLRVEGAQAQSIAGDLLHLQTAAGEISLPLLHVESSAPAQPAPALAAPQLEGSDVIAPFARPALQSAAAPAPQSALGIGYSTLFGGMFDDSVAALAVGGDGSAYVTGSTFSPNFPSTPGAFDTGCGTDTAKKCNFDGNYYYDDAFVVKLDPAGTAPVYATFLGGHDGDYGYGIAVDSAGAAYVTGETFSPDFPATNNAFDDTCGADGNCSYDSDSGYFADAFVVKINSAGTALDYATFLGDINYDWGNAIAVDAAGAAYVTGVTHSPKFPTTTGAFDRICGTDGKCTLDAAANTVRPDAFVTKLNPTGSNLIYSTFLGGTRDDRGFDIAVDAGGSAYVIGNTISSDLPTTSGAYDRGCGTDGTCDFDGDNTVYYDAFVTKVDPAGGSLAYSTYLGGAGGDGGFGIALDQTNAAYVTGYTYSSSGFPISPGALDPSFNGIQDAFVAKINPAGAALGYATLLGGGASDDGHSIAVDSAGNAFVAGITYSANFPISSDGYDATFNGDDDAFVTELDPSGTQLAYSTFLGGDSTDEAYGIRLDGSGSVYVAGLTSSASFPVTTGAVYIKGTCGSAGGSDHNCYDAFVTKLTPVAGPAPENTRMFLPMAMRMTYVAPPDPLCDQYEPNNSRYETATPIAIGTAITAKICQKEGLAQPDTDYEDNYRLTTSLHQPLQVKLTLPQTLIGQVALGVYDTTAPTNPIGGCYKDIVGTSSYTMNCNVPNVGAATSAYVVRIYSSEGVFDNTQQYTLIVTQ